MRLLPAFGAIVLCAIPALAPPAAAQPQLPRQRYGDVIVTPASMRPETRAAVDDLRQSLQRVTGHPRRVEAAPVNPPVSPPASAIVLSLADGAPPAAQRMLEAVGTSQEACCLWPAGDQLWLVGRSELALSHAIYLYLERLGCRWYFPSERWTLAPKRDDIRLREPWAGAPEFRSRLFFGTGGFGGKLPLDPERQIESRWLDWQRRNRFGGEFRISGHTGEAFNLKYRQQLEQHPEWRAMVDGQRVPWSLTAKFCAGNPEVVDLYVQDRLAAFRAQRQRDPGSPRAAMVSVEPADGGGHCAAPESLAIGSVSDRVFHVANQVARPLRDEFPLARVSLLAYNEHAAVPSIALEPNVYVQVVPYAFQRTGLTPEQLLTAWSHKVPSMGVYDYWSIPDWSHDLPTFDPIKLGPERLRRWRGLGVDSYLCESTFSSGAMGLAWQVATRLAWEPDTKPESIVAEFTVNCFGPAAPPMQRMLERWSRGFLLCSHELALSFRDLDEAWELAKGDSAVAARIEDYARYVQYLRLRFDYEQTPRGSEPRRAAAGRLATHLWNIYDTSMVHAFRLSQLLARDERLAGNPEIATRYDWTKADAPGWQQPPTTTSPVEFIRSGARELTPQDFQPRSFHGPLVRLPGETTRLTAMSKPTAEHEAGWTPVMTLNNSLDFQVFAAAPGETLKLRISAPLEVRLLISDANGQPILETKIEHGDRWREQWAELEAEFPAPGLYTVRIVAQRRTFRVSLRDDLPHSLSGWHNSQGQPTPRLYFYVPRGVKQLAIYTNYTAAGPPRFFAPDGAEVPPRSVDNGQLMMLPVAPQSQGKIWSLDRAKCAIGPLRMLNAPGAFSFSPATLLVPADALE